jgi:hypothetical protein
LERAYLALVVQAIRQPVPPDAEREVRAALSALADSLDRLPEASPGDVADDDPDELSRRAQEREQQAQTEADPVARASLVRQAESLRRRRASLARSALLIRRTAILRHELDVQIDTLRASLAAFNTGAAGGGAGDVADLAEAAESVRRVAFEADHIATAREELDTIPSTDLAALPAATIVAPSNSQSPVAVSGESNQQPAIVQRTGR